jgi:hypothetical protein
LLADTQPSDGCITNVLHTFLPCCSKHCTVPDRVAAYSSPSSVLSRQKPSTGSSSTSMVDLGRYKAYALCSCRLSITAAVLLNSAPTADQQRRSLNLDSLKQSMVALKITDDNDGLEHFSCDQRPISSNDCYGRSSATALGKGSTPLRKETALIQSRSICFTWLQ